jgi:hypothetical protein
MKGISCLLSVCGLVSLLSACNKTNEHITVSQQEFSEGTFLQPGDTLNSINGSSNQAIKGTLKAGGIYYLSSEHGDAVINQGDTLVVQAA